MTPRFFTGQTLTVKHLADVFHRDDKTIRRWIDEDKKIMLGNDIYFEPHKDPAGHWLFRVVVIEIVVK